jgi:hypothetical protein
MSIGPDKSLVAFKRLCISRDAQMVKCAALGRIHIIQCGISDVRSIGEQSLQNPANVILDVFGCADLASLWMYMTLAKSELWTILGMVQAG